MTEPAPRQSRRSTDQLPSTAPRPTVTLPPFDPTAAGAKPKNGTGLIVFGIIAVLVGVFVPRIPG